MNKIKNSRKGFTLLELLVVVIIIGILAAIALPQYQLSVDKADFAKMQETATAITEAYKHYYLIHGTTTKDFNNLYLEFPNAEKYQNTYINCITMQDMYCCISKGGIDTHGGVSCGKKDLSFVFTNQVFAKNLVESPKRICKALIDSPRATRLCQSMGNYEKKSNAPTPQGISALNYSNYIMN